MSLMDWHFAQQEGLEQPNLGVVPTAVHEANVAVLDGSRIDRFGFSFQVPWNVIASDRTLDAAAPVAFKEGAGVLVFNPASRLDAAKAMRGATDRDLRIMTEVFGKKTLSGNYELMAAEVDATPNDAKWWAGRARNARVLVLLMYKRMNLGDAAAIHTVSAGGVRGFQFGDPDAAPFLVRLELFDTADRNYEIILTGKQANKPVITQAEINALVASFRPISVRPVSVKPANS